MKVIVWQCLDTGHLHITWPIGLTVPPWEEYLHPMGDFQLEGEPDEMYLDRCAMSLLVAVQQHKAATGRNGYLPERFQRMPDIYPMLLPQSRRYRNAWRWQADRIVVDAVEAAKLRKEEIKRAKIAAYLESIGVLTYEEELQAEDDIHELLASEWPAREQHEAADRGTRSPQHANGQSEHRPYRGGRCQV